MKSQPMVDDSVLQAEGCIITGNTRLEKDSSVWYNAVLRGDEEEIVVGEGSNIQDNCVVHCSEHNPVHIGKYVTVGHGAIIHGCTIGDETLIGMGAIILDGVKIGNNCMVGAGTLVTHNKKIPDGSLVFGNPGKIMRKLTEAEVEEIRVSAYEYIERAKKLKNQG